MKAISICIGRKGSKGLPGKNTMLIKNKPMAYMLILKNKRGHWMVTID